MTRRSPPRCVTMVRMASRTVICCSVVAGCAVGPNFVRPDPPAGKSLTAGVLPAQTMLADGTAQRFVSGQKVTANWWQLFACPELDAVVADSLARSPTLKRAAFAVLDVSAHEGAKHLSSGLVLGLGCLGKRRLQRGIDAKVEAAELRVLTGSWHDGLSDEDL